MFDRDSLQLLTSGFLAIVLTVFVVGAAVIPAEATAVPFAIHAPVLA